MIGADDGRQNLRKAADMKEITRNAVAAAMPDLFTLVGQIETSLKAVRSCADKFEAVAPEWKMIGFDAEADEGEPYRILLQRVGADDETVVYGDGETWEGGDRIDVEWTQDQQTALSDLVYAAMGAQYQWGTLACTVWQALTFEPTDVPEAFERDTVGNLVPATIPGRPIR